MEAVGIEGDGPHFNDVSKGIAHASYFPEGRLNISDSCFNKREDHEPALIYAMESEPRALFGVLNQLSIKLPTSKLNWV